MQERQASQLKESQLAFCNSQHDKLAATQQMLCDVQASFAGDR